jgi:hypothetical protein
MRNLLIYLLVFVLYSGLAAQELFVQPGAKWSYEELNEVWEWPPHPKVWYTMIYLEYTGDTIIANEEYKRIDGDFHPWHLQEKDGVIYYLHPKSMTNYTLWDISAGVGDTFYIPRYWQGDSLTVVIEDVYDVEVNEIMTKVQAAQVIPKYFDHGVAIHFNSRFGPLDNYLFFMEYVNFGTDECWDCFTLRCYEDDEMPLYNPVGIPCDSIRPGTTSVQPMDAGGRPTFTIFPNPASGSEVWLLPHMPYEEAAFSIQLMDISGRVVRTWSQSFHTGQPSTLNLPDFLPGGYYMLLLTDPGGHTWQEKLIIAR